MRVRTSLLLVVVALVATACFRSDTRIRVDEDGSGEMSASIALDIDAALDLAQAFAPEDAPEMTAEQACQDFQAEQEIPEGTTAEPFEEDGFCGLRYTIVFGPGEFEEALAQQDTEGEFTLRRDGDGWFFESVFSNGPTGGDDLGDQLMPDEILEGAEITVGVLLPGRQVEHNATYIDSDGTLVWELDPTSAGERIFARTEAGETILGSGQDDGGGSTLLGIVVLVVLAAVVVGVIWLILKRRRERDAAMARPAPVEPASGPPAAPGSAGSSLPPPPPPSA